jgi:CRP-like cAMP-binding protein
MQAACNCVLRHDNNVINITTVSWYTSGMQSPTEKIKPFSQLRAYKKGANIFFQGEAPRRGVMVSDGIVRSYTITTSGEERTIAFFTKNDILPLSWLMETTTTSLFYYEAVTDVRTLQFSREDFKTHILGDPAATLALFNTLSSDHTAAMLRINGLAQSRAEEKVAFTLYYLMFRYGTRTEGDSFHTIDITLRHTMIAGLVGLTRESTSRILSALQKQGIIDYRSGTYRVHKELLESHIGEDAFRDVIM